MKKLPLPLVQFVLLAVCACGLVRVRRLRGATCDVALRPALKRMVLA